jgi:hypothetical protein
MKGYPRSPSPSARIAEMRSLSAIVGVICLPILSSGQVVLTNAEKHKLDLFVSNFVEAQTPSFDARHPLSQDALLEFVVNHTLQNEPLHVHVYVTKAKAEELISHYFGRRLTAFHSTPGIPLVHGKLDFGDDQLENQTPPQGHVVRITKTSSGNWSLDVTENLTSEKVIRGRDTAVVRRVDGRYVLVSWKHVGKDPR